MRRIATLFVMAVVVAGCARPGERAADGGDVGPPEQTGSTLDASPQATLASCVRVGVPQPPGSGADAGSQPTAGATSSPSVPSPRPTVSINPSDGLDERERGEMFERNHSANKAYRQRRPLSSEVQTASQPCVEAVRRELARLGTQGRYGEADLRQVLADAGLFSINVRRSGRLDLAGSGGLLFAGWTGQACVFGEHGANRTEVEAGSQIADGGCLPAPD